MIIKKIVKLKNNKYKIVLDNDKEIVTYDEVIIKYNLLNGLGDSRILDDVIALNEYYNIYYKVLAYIFRRLRSKKEVVCYLEKFKINDCLRDKLVNDFVLKGLIDDEKFAKCFVADHFNLTNEGPLVIKYKLLKHDIAPDIVDNCLKFISEEELLNKVIKLVDKKVLENVKYSNYILKKKLISYLISLGFLNDMIKDVVLNVVVDDTRLLFKDYEKLYARYCLKLSGSLLSYKIKSELFKKGYNSNDINDLLYEKNVH
ncbi:MAG: RecX family transcriptional regulator [Bacilli bacterium]